MIMLAAVVITRFAEPLVDQSSLVMVYVLAVATTAFFLSIGPAILISLCSVFIFDYLNLPPYMEFSRKPAEYLLTLVGMLSIAATISTLAQRLRQKLQESKQRELRTSALYDLSAALAKTQNNDHIISITLQHLSIVFNTHADILSAEKLSEAKYEQHLQRQVLSETLAEKVFTYQEGDTVNVVIPLYIDNQLYAIVTFATYKDNLMAEEQTEHLQTMIRQTVLAIERNNLQHKINQSNIRIQQEELRNSILNAISHDLRTPLATIIGASSSLSEQDVSSQESRQYLSEAIYQEAVHMQSMVENLLEMARLQSGDLHISQEWQAIEEVVGSALVILRRRFKQHDIRVDVPDDLPLIQCDSVLIERVIINLIENAIKHSPLASVVFLQARSNQDFLELLVIDTGAGIPEAEQQKIFDPFYRVNTHKTGFGLGLSICRSIIKAHKGTISLHSVVNHGTTVIVALPIPAHSPQIDIEMTHEVVL